MLSANKDNQKFDVENLNINFFNISQEFESTIYIPNKSGHDFSDALRYGSLIYVTKGQINRFAIGYMARKWMQALLKSKKEDYILITSLTILTVVGAAIFGYLHGRLNILLYRNNKYISRTIVFEQLKEAEKEALYEQQQ